MLSKLNALIDWRLLPLEPPEESILPAACAAFVQSSKTGSQMSMYSQKQASMDNQTSSSHSTVDEIHVHSLASLAPFPRYMFNLRAMPW